MGHGILRFYDFGCPGRGVIANLVLLARGTLAAQLKQGASGTTCTN